jgi:hypothetical protein
MLAGNALADGFSPMELKQVLLKTDTILLVEILQNAKSVTHRNKGQGSPKESVRYDYDIKSKVLKAPVGRFSAKEYAAKYSLVLAKGVWLVIPGSGLEGHMKPGEKYVFLLKQTGEKHTLLRAEKSDALEKILQVKKELAAEDRRVAREQAKIPDGIYRYSNKSGAKRIRLRDGRRVAIGEKCKLDIVRREMHSLYDAAIQIVLSLTLAKSQTERCILLVGGKAYWLFDSSGVKESLGYSPGAKTPPGLYCHFMTNEEARAAAKFFNVPIFYRHPKSNDNVKKKKQSVVKPTNRDAE